MMQGDLPPVVQGVRSLSKNNLDSPIPVAPATVVYIDCRTDRATKQQVVLWDDIKQAFDDALHIRYLSRVIPFLRGEDFSLLKPYRFVATPDVVLDVVVSGQMAQAEVAQPPPSVFEQIAQQATRLPKYDPLAGLRHRPSTPINPLVPRNNTAQTRHNRPSIPLVPRSPAVDNQQIAKEIMKKIAAHIDLEALHKEGDGSPEDFVKALECYLKSVPRGHAHAQVSVGDLFLQGQDVPQDTSMAMDWYLKAAFQGDANAQRKVKTLRLADSNGIAVPNALLETVADDQLAGIDTVPANETPQGNPKRTVHGHEEAAMDNYFHINNPAAVSTTAAARTLLASTIRRTVHGHEEAAMDNYSHIDNPASSRAPRAPQALLDDQNLQEHDIPDPQYSGNKASPRAPQEYVASVAKDLIQTILSATSGDKEAQYTLGDMYKNGEGVHQDSQAAMDWYVKAADQGHVSAQLSIGILYGHGQGVPQDYTQAMAWYRKAADQGDADAQYSIGTMYYNGQGVPLDFFQAMEWYKKSADQGHTEAKIQHDNLKLQRHGVQQFN
ncbi:hypothetical protein BGX23_000203 [Mortierella sp. AD031]|nr:hypothetical protein BGX23_000203 [Mortierella sp. AD031]